MSTVPFVVSGLVAAYIITSLVQSTTPPAPAPGAPAIAQPKSYDLNGDGVVNSADQALLQGNWGPVPAGALPITWGQQGPTQYTYVWPTPSEQPSWTFDFVDASERHMPHRIPIRSIEDVTPHWDPAKKATQSMIYTWRSNGYEVEIPYAALIAQLSEHGYGNGGPVPPIAAPSPVMAPTGVVPVPTVKGKADGQP